MFISGQHVEIDYKNHNAVGAIQVADFLPVGYVFVNGIDTLTTVTIVDNAGGNYTCSFNCPTFQERDVFEFKIQATTDFLEYWTRLIFDVIGTGIQSAIKVQIVTEQQLPVVAATVYVTEDLAGQNNLTGYVLTNTNGVVQIPLSLDQTNYLWCVKQGYQSIQGQSFTVEQNNVFTMLQMLTPLVQNNSYATLDYANTYMLGQIFSDQWTYATDAKKTTALLQATRIIDNLSYKGRKATSEQVLRWPRIMNDPTRYPTTAILPQNIIDACCEIALALVSGVDPEKEFRNLTRTSGSYGSLRHSKDTSMVEPHFAAGVPSITAWNLLLQWLTDIYTVKLLRA